MKKDIFSLYYHEEVGVFTEYLPSVLNKDRSAVFVFLCDLILSLNRGKIYTDGKMSNFCNVHSVRNKRNFEGVGSLHFYLCTVSKKKLGG